jgi:ATP-dependent DNA helicase DinG
LEDVLTKVALFSRDQADMVFYTAEDEHGSAMLCAAATDLPTKLRQTLWRQDKPMVLTSGTLAVGESFRRFQEATGLATDHRVRESVALSPFQYSKNCLLYFPCFRPHQGDGDYYDKLAREIRALLTVTCGHALVLFTSYAAMSSVKERLRKMDLPFPCPDAIKEKEREKYPTLRAYLRAVAVPEMQIKLRQGFGRAIRTETDTCVVAILDPRAAKGQRYFADVLTALPKMPVTSSLRGVETTAF